MIEEGAGFNQVKGGPVMELHAGETTYVGPGVVHWHGAARAFCRAARILATPSGHGSERGALLRGLVPFNPAQPEAPLSCDREDSGRPRRNSRGSWAFYSKSNRRQDLSGLNRVIWRASTGVVVPRSFPYSRPS